MNGRNLALVIVAAFGAASLLACPGLDALTPASRDAGSEGDATADGAALASDASQDAEAGLCVFIDADFVDALAVPDASCEPSDGGTCTPGYNPMYFDYFQLPPPHAHQARCTGAQISAYLDACPIPYPFDQPSPACQMFINDQANVACVGCLAATPVNSGSAGPIVFSPFGSTEDVAYNAYGCIDLLEPCNKPCAQAMWAGYECPLIACYPSCPLAQVSACAQATATSCMCAAEWAAHQACVDAIQTSGGPATQCLVATGILAAFCGGS